MPAAQPFGVTDLLLGFGSLLLVSGAPVTTVVVGREELRGGSPLRGRCELGPEDRERLPRLSPKKRSQTLLPAYGL